MDYSEVAAAPRLVIGLLLAVGCVAQVLAGCGEDSPASPTAKTAAARPVSTGKTIAGKTEPALKVPQGPPPTRLGVKDIEVGEGPKARVGDDIEVEFAGITWDGEVRFSSWTYPSPPVFELGGRDLHRLYYGLDLGVRGMRPGGRREVIVPSTLVDWPDAGQAPLPPSNGIVFVIDLLKIK